jgi:hypothetical protein
VVRGARGVGRETRAATLQLRAVVLRHAPAWAVGDRNGQWAEQLIGSTTPTPDARGRRCGCGAWCGRVAVSAHLAPRIPVLPNTG